MPPFVAGASGTNHSRAPQTNQRNTVPIPCSASGRSRCIQTQSNCQGASQQASPRLIAGRSIFRGSSEVFKGAATLLCFQVSRLIQAWWSPQASKAVKAHTAQRHIRGAGWRTPSSRAWLCGIIFRGSSARLGLGASAARIAFCDFSRHQFIFNSPHSFLKLLSACMTILGASSSHSLSKIVAQGPTFVHFTDYPANLVDYRVALLPRLYPSKLVRQQNFSDFTSSLIDHFVQSPTC